ncbi:MAG: hypothetical protein P8J27_15375 [Mariniblastus sp.]|nr:hypothetical protein [Mariniblastus sp.]
MNYKIHLSIPCLLAALVICGCGPSSGTISPVSGKLTLDGEPMAGVEIIFSPKMVEGNANPGPYSVGTTDAAGDFTLKTRYGDEGAVVGSHIVTMQYSDIEAGVMEELRGELEDIKTSGEGDAEDIKAQMAAVTEKLKGRAVIPADAEGEFVVKQGVDNVANFAFEAPK